jgi:exopolyphosphatase / guanosine-5'-triphosphate,3'-diphosphate pyrophosphatase
VPGPLHAIIDIGSNSVRLVVYGPPLRAPAIVFNEKVMAGLGRVVAASGQLEESAMTVALTALERFALLARSMNCTSVRAVATAAVRDAANGADFVQRAAAIGVVVEVISGEAEAEAAGWGVLAGIPGADGIVGDLGGGSLELVRIVDGAPADRLSLPLGVFRLSGFTAKHGQLDRIVKAALAKASWPLMAKGAALYLVGGSWRALSRVHMELTDYPLRVLHNYAMPSAAAARLSRAVAHMERKRLRGISGLPSGRLATLKDAASLLAVLTRALEPSALVVSASGLREGLMYRGLSQFEQSKDPLLEGVREAAARQVRFDQHGDLLGAWIAPLFLSETTDDARLRTASCLLGDVAWAANPDFRAERGVDFALHGNWTGIDARGRAMMAQALHISFGGGQIAPIVSSLASADDLGMATRWGLAMRLGQRLSGGTADPLKKSSLSIDGEHVRLGFAPGSEPFYGDAVRRRHRALATALGRQALVSSIDRSMIRPVQLQSASS